MSSSITFQTRDDAEGLRILDAFEERTGLRPDGPGRHTRSYPLMGDDHRIKVVRTLDAIDEHWPAHLALEMPA